MHSAVALAMVLPSMARGANGGMPSGWFHDRKRVAVDLSRAREKVAHGGAKWKIRLWPAAAKAAHLDFNAATSVWDKKFTPPVSRSSGGAVATPARLTAAVRWPFPANTSKKSTEPEGADEEIGEAKEEPHSGRPA